MNFKFIGGQTVVELLVALGIASLVIFAIVSAAITSLSNVTFSRQQAQANRRAQEAMEWLRQERDSDWKVFVEKAGPKYCLNTFAWNLPAECEKIPGTELIREAVMSLVSSDEVEAAVTVTWQDAKGNHEVKLNSNFTNWRKE